MTVLRLGDAAKTLGSACDSTMSDHVINAVSTDSRNIGNGNLFVALKGERFDGHDYVFDVLQRGAVAAIVNRNYAEEHFDPRLLVVDEPLIALAQLALYWRQKFFLPVIGVVGSNGKTTVRKKKKV